MPYRGDREGVGVALKERRDLFLPSARNTEQVQYSRRPPGLEQRPQGVEQARCWHPPAVPHRWGGAASARRGGGARCPRRCRARPAGWRRTGGRPTRRPVGRHRRPHLGRAAQPLQVLVDALAAARVDVQRQQVHVGALQQVGGFAAGRGTGVEHPVGARQPARPAAGGGQLGRTVLHRAPGPCGKTGQRSTGCGTPAPARRPRPGTRRPGLGQLLR
jgi:hypothetical protein